MHHDLLKEATLYHHEVLQTLNHSTTAVWYICNFAIPLAVQKLACNDFQASINHIEDHPVMCGVQKFICQGNRAYNIAIRYSNLGTKLIPCSETLQLF